ncbi:hypothetical protein TVAG_245230 [Trichomonas vaginalis G3]|uniref:Uncharacterized protein n=1 Tax=Trichomonas vaginalis (strain ATCC PRA-98 / G3) TaxID=412133 RepID=A2FPE6_TRIV3|nr:glycoprotein 38 family [Trichomonas vaginalis G3]EAX93219.1 hypothetical protein TVAG_245230 [Trichomonas vaginalis G3]KAI5539469.1 glycoprotein 38 family [Trichomonas vaginalis G3]|eukprot:XP_001306149.1 hypothetical protein [Trichomonas vaginalis G3]
MMFLFAATGLSVFKVDKTKAFPDDCKTFHEPKKNGKTKLVNLKKDETLCFDSSYIMGSSSKFDVYAAIQKQNETSQEWYWEHKDKVESALAVLGTYSAEDNDYIDPVAKVVCTEKTCKIQVLEVSPSYGYEVNTTDKGVTVTTRYVMRSFLNSFNEGDQETYVRFSKNKVNDNQVSKTEERSAAFFAFPEPRHMTFSRNENLGYLYSGTGKWDDKKISGTIGSPKTSYFYVNEKEDFKPTEDKEGNYDLNMSCNFTWSKKEKSSSEDSEPTEFYFPEVSGQFSTEGGVYTADDFNEASSGGLPGWAIALIVIGVVIVVAVVIVVVVIVVKKKN